MQQKLLYNLFLYMYKSCTKRASVGSAACMSCLEVYFYNYLPETATIITVCYKSVCVELYAISLGLAASCLLSHKDINLQHNNSLNASWTITIHGIQHHKRRRTKNDKKRRPSLTSASRCVNHPPSYPVWSSSTLNFLKTSCRHVQQFRTTRQFSLVLKTVKTLHRWLWFESVVDKAG